MEVLGFFATIAIAIIMTLVVGFTALAASMALCITVKTIKEKVGKGGETKNDI